MLVPAAARAADELPQPLALARVERRGRLVEQRDAGWASRPMAMLTRWRLPPESRPSCSSARSRNPVCSSIRVTAASASRDALEPREQPQVLRTESFE